MRKPLAIGIATAMLLSGVAVVASPAAAHVTSDSRDYVANCDLVIGRCALAPPDPTGGQICSSGTCRAGGVFWDAEVLVQIHDGILGDGLDVKASIDDEVNPTWGRLCVAQDFSDTDTDGTVCNDPASEPDQNFCGSSAWLEESLVPPFEEVDNNGDGTVDEPDWGSVFFGGPVSQALSNAPDPIGGVNCDPAGAGATAGTATISVRE